MKEADYTRIYATQVNQKWQLHLFYISNANVNHIMNAKLDSNAISGKYGKIRFLWCLLA